MIIMMIVVMVIYPGCDRIPIESLEWDNPECVFVMVLALAGSYHEIQDHDGGDHHHDYKIIIIITIR